ncbi:integrase/recombinase XerD [Alkalihalobacillus xiaoxiensis]|uniref:Integrase/recombinase XerD n=1 Tax=Shouchella xiaoxiensis TaxID=766895 RepID=A0ABS2ST25_9BACI|nr:tyrosine-type recombinase/integrase [Shouchella xiaoxiensis]MBM7838336.1 integrase/recombinase XerD [Shouchella xiaoxiensis]
MQSVNADKRKGRTKKNVRSGVIARKTTTNLIDVFERFIHAKKAAGRAQGTLESYKSRLSIVRSYEAVTGEKMDMQKLTAEDFQDFIVYMLEDHIKFDKHRFKKKEHQTLGLSPRTANDVIKNLRQVYAYAMDYELIDSSPLDKVDAVKYTEKRIEIMSPDEVRHFFSSLDQRNFSEFRDYVLSTFLLDSMCRINEAVNLREQDFDFSQNFVRISAEFAKNRKSRVVPFQRRTGKMLRELIEENREFNTEYVFVANYGERLTTNHFRTQLRRYAEKAGMKRYFYPHLFRHTGATWYLEAEGDIRRLQMILGHADLRMTERYTHLTGRSIAKSHERHSPMNQVIGKMNKPRKR